MAKQAQYSTKEQLKKLIILANKNGLYDAADVVKTLLQSVEQKPASKKVSKKQNVICQVWEESERGWGVRPDGCSLHLSMDDHKKYMEEYIKDLPKEVPDEYSRVCGDPKIVEVGSDLFKKIKKSKNGIRFFQHEMQELGIK